MSTTDKPYQPIECGLYSEYELAIMHKSTVILSWLDQNEKKLTETIEPIDLLIRDKQEFLKFCTQDNTTIEIRLDRISNFKSIS